MIATGGHPFLRPIGSDANRGDPIPLGWVAHPVGPRDGIDHEVVFCSASHDVAVEWRQHGQAPLSQHRAELAEAGWRPLAETSVGTVWGRERPDPLALAFERLHATPPSRPMPTR